jgi:hypothetical protein
MPPTGSWPVVRPFAKDHLKSLGGDGRKPGLCQPLAGVFLEPTLPIPALDVSFWMILEGHFESSTFPKLGFPKD